MLARREIRAMALIALVALGFALAETVAGIGSGVMHLAPALLLALPLLAGRYVGEERLAVMVRRRAAPRTRGAVLLQARLPRVPRVRIARGGALLASALAQRGPPAVLLAAR